MKITRADIAAPRSWALPLAMRQAQRMLDADDEARDPAVRALREVAEVRELAGIRPVGAHMPDVEIRALADRRVEVMRNRIDAIAGPTDARGLLAWLNAEVHALDARPDAFAFEGDRPEVEQLRGIMERAKCAMWWRRQLRRAVVRLCETEAVRAGKVCATKRTPYVTHETHARHRQRQAANLEMMQATQLENSAGQVYSLADLAAKSPGSKSIRRGELMITGCEALAETSGHRGVFLTLTAPSRFHSTLRHGAKNPKHEGATPRDAHEWLCRTWARARARLQRIGVRFYGFRVAEPHHDGCPHWHELLWCEPGQLWRLVLNLRRWWLKDCGDEAGARQHRVKAVLMRSGGAAGYIAKYIAKNIDDTGIDGHRDEAFDGPGQMDLDGGNATRVEAWASAWGIRQFQAVGQPPVTPWRELRRVSEADQAGATPRLGMAFEAVNRKGARRASWALYVLAQGGLMKGRDYLLRIATETLKREGRYETTEQPRPVGVYDVTARDTWHLSARQEWKPRGAWARVNDCGGQRPVKPPSAEGGRPTVVHPWTRVNNCTRATVIDGRIIGRADRFKTWAQLIEPGGSASFEEKPPCPTRNAPPSSSPQLSRLALLRSLT
jgi:hypothetical protein